MSRVVFLLEDYSTRTLLEGLLPRFLPALRFQCISHEGKQDLEKSIVRKLRAWKEPGVHFVVLRDNDGGDCHALKARLLGLCKEGRRSDSTVRIACQELEAWYLGDCEALAGAFGQDELRNLHARERFRDPDAIAQPSRALEELIPSFQKVSGARSMARHLSPGANRSRSFNVFLEAVRAAANGP